VTKRPGLLRRRRYNRLSDDVQIGASCWLCSGVRSILIGSSPRTSLVARTTPTLVAKIAYYAYYNERLLPSRSCIIGSLRASCIWRILLLPSFSTGVAALQSNDREKRSMI